MEKFVMRKLFVIRIFLIYIFFIFNFASYPQAIAIASPNFAICSDSTVWNWKMVPAQDSSRKGIKAIAGGQAYTLVLKNDCTVWASGWNDYGQLGNGTNSYSNVPVQVTSLTGITAISAGGDHALALQNDSTVWAWGSNYHGMLGNGTNTNSNVPVPVSSLTGITAISLCGCYSDAHSLALKNDGTVWGWGDNGSGELGNGNNTPSNVPVKMNSLGRIIAIATGSWHSMILKNDGTIWTCGYNNVGQLGNGNNNSSNILLQVGSLTGIIAVAAGAGHSLALKNDGTVWAWGYNLNGQLGNGSTPDTNVPVQVSFLTGIIAIAAGSENSLALKNDGTVWVWGEGPLGDGTYNHSYVPVQVTGLCQFTTAANEITQEQSISVFPNPSSGIFTVNFSNKNIEAKICVYDLLGNRLWEKDYQNDVSPTIDLSNQPKGIYFVELLSGGKSFFKKVSVQ